MTRLALASGAEGRLTNGNRDATVVLVNGGRAADVPGTWSTTLEWLVRRLAPRFGDLGFLEVRYRTKSWHRLESCLEDARAAIAAAVDGGASRVALVGFSMGGAVSVLAAAEPPVRAVIGLAPWLPDRLSLEPLRGRRFAVVHGSLDRSWPGIPGVSAASSRRAFERARSAGVVDAEYTLLPGALHGIAVRTRSGRHLPLPRARRWTDLVARELERFGAAA